MKQVFFVLLNIVITNGAWAQGITKNGKVTTTGTEYVNKNGAIGTSFGVNKNGEIVASVVPLAVGDSIQGGKIFYIFAAGDPGYVAGEVHGLIAATTNLKEGTVKWGSSLIDILGTVSGIGYGNANTILITAGDTTTTAVIAARLCADLTLNGYSDWYLPSIDELNVLIMNRDLIGGFPVNGIYWSSSQMLSGFRFQENAWRIFISGSVPYPADTGHKGSPHLVRPVRSF